MDGNLSGTWTGELSGTNVGGMLLQLVQEFDRLYGTGRFHEPALGAYEYEIQGVEMQGWPIHEQNAKEAKTMYLVIFEEVRFAVLGHISHIPDPQVLKQFVDVDVLLLPVGDGFLSSEDMIKIVRQLEPAVAIPSYVKKPDAMFKAIGQPSQVQEKFVFKKKDLAGKKGEVIVLESKIA